MAGRIALRAWLLSDSGLAIPSRLVEAFVSGTTSPAATGSTDANGQWSFASLSEATYDVKQEAFGAARWLRGGRREQLSELQVVDLLNLGAVASVSGLLAAHLPAITHASTTGQGVNDHHAKSHAHTAADGSGAIASDQDISTTKNIGLGTTDIEAWSWPALEGYRAALVFQSNAPAAYLPINAYYDGAWKRKAVGTAALIQHDTVGTTFYVAATGAADSAITWTHLETLYASGGLYLGGTASDPGTNNLTVQGGLKAASIVNDTGLASGTYTPTLTNVANLDASTAYVCRWMRVGNMVTVSGIVNVDPTTTATRTQLGMSLPVASAFTDTTDCTGAGAGINRQEAVAIAADITNDRAQLDWVCVTTANSSIAFVFTYTVM